MDLQKNGSSVLVRVALGLALGAVPALGQVSSPVSTLPATLDPLFSGVEPDPSASYGLVYVPLDSWVYPAFERLYSMGYADSAFLGLRPWTRTACLQILIETYTKLQDAPNDEEAWGIFQALAKEFGLNEGPPSTRAELSTRAGLEAGAGLPTGTGLAPPGRSGRRAAGPAAGRLRCAR